MFEISTSECHTGACAEECEHVQMNVGNIR